MSAGEEPKHEGGAALVPWQPVSPPAALAPPTDGPRWFKNDRVRSSLLLVGGFAGLVVFWNVAKLAAFASLLFGVGGGSVLRLARGDEQGRLDRVLRGGIKDPDQAERVLLNFSKAGSSAHLRWSARAWAALYAVERGDVERAVRLYGTQDGWDRAWREGGMAADAIVVPAILAWLVPTAFPSNSLPKRSMIDVARMPNAPLRSELVASLLLALEALEATAQDDPSFAMRALQRLEASMTASQLPRLSLLVRASVAKQIPELREEIEAELDDSGRTFLAKFLPSYAQEGGQGVFRSAHAGAASPSSGPLVRATARAPEVVREQVEVAARTRARARIVRHVKIDQGLRSAAWISFGGIFVLGPIVSGTGAAIAFWSMIGTMFARRVHRRFGRARTRISSLLGLQGLALPAWCRELDREFPALIYKENYDASAGGAQAQGALAQETFVSCARAERAWRQGDLAAVEQNIAWCFRGLTAEAVDPQVMRICGASLVRLAAITGRDALARQLLAHARQHAPAIWRRPIRGSIYGGAPGALDLAAALVEAREGDWEQAAHQLHKPRFPGVLAIYPRDRLVYARIRVSARNAGYRVKTVGVGRPSAADLAWLARVWPQLQREVPAALMAEVP